MFPRKVTTAQAEAAEEPVVSVPDTPATLLSTDETALPPAKPEIVPPVHRTSRPEAKS